MKHHTQLFMCNCMRWIYGVYYGAKPKTRRPPSVVVLHRLTDFDGGEFCPESGSTVYYPLVEFMHDPARPLETADFAEL